MAARFVNSDRPTPMVLPGDLRAWWPADHIVPFILAAVEQLPLNPFHVHARGTGSAQDPPAMRLPLLISSYATGRFGSRPIEAATHGAVAGRYRCANRPPDPASLCPCRTANAPAFVAAFTHVLQLAHQLRRTRVRKPSWRTG